MSAKLRRLLRPTLVAQVAAATGSILQIRAFSVYLHHSVYAAFVVLAAVWAVLTPLASTPASMAAYRAQGDEAAFLTIHKRDIVNVAVASILCAGAVAVALHDPTLALLAIGALWTFIIGDLRMASLLARRREWTFAAAMGVRTVSPPLIVAGLHGGMEVSATAVVLAMAAGNLVASAFPPLTRIRFSAQKSTGQSLAVASVALWCLASLDRIVIAPFVSSQSLVVYAQVYGLMDRGFRIPSTALTNHLMPRALRGEKTSPPKWWPIAVVGLVLVAIPATQVLLPFLNAGAYAGDLGVSVLIAVGLGLSAIAVPVYVADLADHRDRWIAFTAVVAVVVDVVGNLVLVHALGILGAALMTALSYGVWFGGLAAIVFAARRRRPSIRTEETDVEV